MGRLSARTVLIPVIALAALSSSSCASKGPQYYPVRGRVIANGEPAHGVLVALHLEGDTSLKAVRPSATTIADGSFEIKTYVADDQTVKDGAPAGKYVVTCVWWPLDRSPYVGGEIPDKLKRKYSNPHSTPLRAEVVEGPNDLHTIELKY